MYVFRSLMHCVQITKSASKKKDTVMYSFRQSIPIIGMIVYVFETPCKLLSHCVLLVMMSCCRIMQYVMLIVKMYRCPIRDGTLQCCSQSVLILSRPGNYFLNQLVLSFNHYQLQKRNYTGQPVCPCVTEGDCVVTQGHVIDFCLIFSCSQCTAHCGVFCCQLCCIHHLLLDDVELSFVINICCYLFAVQSISSEYN